MLQGYSTPRTPSGRSAIAPRPPWHYAGDCLAVEFEAAPEAVRAMLPAPLSYADARCAAYFVDWQFASEDGDERREPIAAQYKETIFLISAQLGAERVSYCPFIWVDQDTALMRGLIQGWPKQLGSTWLSRASPLESPAAPQHAPGGRFCATLAAKDRRLAEAEVTLREASSSLPQPSFASAVNIRYFPNLAQGQHDRPTLHELVRLKSRNIQVGPILRGEASLVVHDHPSLELALLRPQQVGAGYRFSFALTVDDLETLADLRG